MYTEGRGGGRHEYLQTVCLQKNFVDAGNCIGCGKCEKICPQSLEIRNKLKEADKELLPFYYKIGLRIIKKLGFLG